MDPPQEPLTDDEDRRHVLEELTRIADEARERDRQALEAATSHDEADDFPAD